MKRFEDLDVWKKARELVKDVYIYTKRDPFHSDFGLSNQIQRAAVSIMSNVAEGFERGGNKELVNFLSIAKGSCGEVRCQVYIAFDLGYIAEDEFKSLLNKCISISVKLQSLMQSLKQSDFKGSKYKR